MSRGRIQTQEEKVKRSISLKLTYSDPKVRERLRLARLKQYENGFNPTLGKRWKKTEAQKDNKRGEKNPEWKGDKVGYFGLHAWVKRYLGNPDKCSDCGKDGLYGRKIHWANKSREYKRELTDWIRFCVRCHVLYDRTWENRERNKLGQFITIQ